MFNCLFVCLFVDSFFCFNHRGALTGSFPENFLKIRLDLGEILRIRTLDWHDGGGTEGSEEGERGRNPIL